MNFDGTYPGTQKSENGVLLEHKPEKEAKGPPVHVVVSYAASEEWDGRNKCCTSCHFSRTTKIALLSVIVILIGVAGYFIYKNISPSEIIDGIGTSVIKTPAEVEKPTDEILQRYLLNQIDSYYLTRKQSMENPQRLQFFLREFARMQEQNESLSSFLNDMDLPLPVVLPKDPDMNLGISDYITNYLNRTIAWLKIISNEEKVMSSYDFQVNRKDQSLVLLHKQYDLSQGDREELNGLRAAYINPPNIAVTNHSIILEGKVIVFSEVINIITSVAPKDINQITIVSEIIYWDENMTRNINIAVFATKWECIDNVVLDLSGRHVDRSISTKDGKPGRPGQNGGHFLGVGTSLRDFSCLKIITDGGDGENGHDGPDGKHGVTSSRPARKLQHPKCMVPCDEPTKLPSDHPAQMFRVYADEACGEEGYDGGAAGPPGQGGPTILISPKGQIVAWGRDGGSASPGKKGEAGVSAPWGCYVVAYRTGPNPRPATLYRWDPITNVKCDNNSIPLLRHDSIAPASTKIQKRSLDEFQMIVNGFASLARNNYAKDSNIFNLLKLLEDSPFIANVTTPIDLFEEYTQLHYNYTHVEIFQSFNKKLQHVLRFTGEDGAFALQYLQTAVYTKMSLLNAAYSEYYIVDLSKYVEQALETVKHLDVNVFSHDNSRMPEILKKVNELVRFLPDKHVTACDKAMEDKDHDTNIICLSTTIADTLDQLISMVSSVLTRDTMSSHYERINATINKLTTLKRNYRMKAMQELAGTMNISQSDPMVFMDEAFSLNRSKAEPILACAEVMLPAEHCFNSTGVWHRWDTHMRRHSEILTAYTAMNIKDPLLSVRTVLKTVLINLKESRAKKVAWKSYVSDIRRFARDLLALTENCQGAVDEDSLFQRIAQVKSMKIPENKKLAAAVDKTKNLIVLNLLRYNYQKAYNAYQQWAYPYTDTIPVVSNDSKEELILGIEAIEKALRNYQTVIHERDQQIKRAAFQTDSPTGPFYTWASLDYKGIIQELFKGRVVQMTASLDNSPHFPLKQAIKFHSIQLYIENVPSEILFNFAVELTHTGFSHYSYNGTPFTSVGPQVRLYHSFDKKHHSNRPSVVNEVYKKLKQGDLMLSPFTTWMMKLEAANSGAQWNLLQAHAENASLHLVGNGWYTTTST